jgi:hypothetical protein
MEQQIETLDVVALLEAVPARGLVRGQVGTVVERLAHDAFEVEFSDENGRAFATAALHAHQLMRLHHKPVQAA